MTLSRRTFLKTITLASSAWMLSPMMSVFANTIANNDDIDYHALYLTALDNPANAPLNDLFTRTAARHPIGLILYDLSNQRLLSALSPENPMPVASAFKAAVLMYFLHYVPRDVWGNVDVAYWAIQQADEVPDTMREAWRRNFVILRQLYQTLVMSDNATTGAVLSYVAQVQGRRDALAAFNDWARDVVGVSQLSGLSGWSEGVIQGLLATDTRFAGRETALLSQLTPFENMMTPRDLGLFYMWMLTHMDDAQRKVCRDLLSTIHNNRGANLERLALAGGGVPYSKNGSLDTDEGYVVTDAGLLDFPDGRSYLIVMQSVHVNDREPSRVPAIFEKLGNTIHGRYNEIIHSKHHNLISGDELLALYTTHLEQAYPQTPIPDTGAYQYGFIMPEGVNIYASPNENDPLHNPIIKVTRFGVRLLMQGALIRYADVDDEWVELKPDDSRDNVRVRLGRRIFIKRRDVWKISLDYAQPIPYINTQSTGELNKFIVINARLRQLWAFEGTTPVIRTPIVLNPDTTPRGAQVITSKWFARSMQPWAPGVPFTSFFGSEGYALHGSPWQRWSTTVNQNTIAGRTSAGCVNVPDWMISAGGMTRPADELLFRWVGGMESAGQYVYEYPSRQHPAIRIFTVDYNENLQRYYHTPWMIETDIAWDAIIAAMDTIDLQAPDSFFV